MSKVLDLNSIRIGIEETDRNSVLKVITDIAYENEIIQSKDDYYNGLLAREGECTTGFGNGFAIPHCKSNTVRRAAVIVCKLNNEVDWEAMDDKPVKFILALAIPETEAGTTHLKILSQLARLLMNSDFTEKLRNVNTKEEIYLILNNELEGGK